ncbi:MAG: winged helix-turn-helix transcriptional regulator [Candidatus Parvarchaeota archaeon]
MTTEKSPNDHLRVLEGQAGNLRVIIFLLEHGETNFQGIVEGLPLTGRSMYSVVEKLSGLGLIKTRIDKSKYPPRNMISLTDKGKKVAKKLKEIEEILGGE